MIRWALVVAAGCAGGVDGEYRASCELGCDEYLYEDGADAVCKSEREVCVASCLEITAEADGLCAACLTTDGLEGPSADLEAKLCELGYLTPESCGYACGAATSSSSSSY
ncbi:MAG: hypothetical protein ABMA64_37120 [Myxococcota bacterium]